MKIFHCDHCDQLVFFENTQCVSCGRRLAFLPDIAEIGSLDPAGYDRWQSPLEGAATEGYRLCANYTNHDVCNWALPPPSTYSLTSFLAPGRSYFGKPGSWM